MQRILLTGANGYIGRRLKHKLLQIPSIKLRLFVKHSSSVVRDEAFEVVEGNTFDT